MFTLKMCGALAAGFGAALYGFGISKGIMEKCHVQGILIRILQELERGISASRTISEIFSSFGNGGTDGEIPQELLRALCERNEKPLYSALKNYDGINLIERAQRNVLFDFALHLGTYGNIDDEIGSCKKVRNMLEQQKAQSESADRQKAELAAKLGVLAAGAIIVIVGL